MQRRPRVVVKVLCATLTTGSLAGKACSVTRKRRSPSGGQDALQIRCIREFDKTPLGAAYRVPQ